MITTKPFDAQGLPVGSGKAKDTTLINKTLSLLETTRGFTTRLITLPGGETMLLRTKGGMPQITYEAPPKTQGAADALTYMTSGAYDLGVSNLANPELTTDAITYKSGNVTVNEAATIAVVFDKPPPVDGQVSLIYNVPTFDPANLTVMKLALGATPPSVFSGLMRRMVQGRYGVGKVDLSIGPTYVYGEGVDNRVHFGWQYSATTGVICFSKDYYIVKLETDVMTNRLTVTSYPLSLDASIPNTLASKIHRKLATTTGNQRAAWETLFLANATTSNVLGVVIGEFAVPSGDPVAYGWNFSITSNRADVVVSYNPGYAYDREIWSRMAMEFKRIGTTLSCSVQLVEQVDGHMISSRSPIWKPSFGQTVWRNKYGVSPNPPVPQDIPVYVFYKDDELVVVRWAWSSVDKPYSPTDEDAVIKEAAWGASIYGAGDSSFSADYTYGPHNRHGFYSQGVNTIKTSGYTERTTKGSISLAYSPEPQGFAYAKSTIGVGFFTDASFYLQIGAQYNSFNPYVYPAGLTQGAYPANPHIGDHWGTFEQVYAAGSITQSSDVKDFAHVTAFVVPAGDCSRAYAGGKMQKSSVYTEVNVTGLSGITRHDEWFLAEDREASMGYWYPPVMSQMTPIYSPNLTGGTQVTDDPVAATTITYAIDMVGSHPQSVGGEASQIFSPNVSTPTLSAEVSSRTSSIFADSKFRIGDLSGDESTTNGYPTAIDLFIGAS